MTHAGSCCRAISSSAATLRAVRISSPSARAVPEMRLVNNKSSQSRMPIADIHLLLSSVSILFAVPSVSVVQSSNRLRPALPRADADAILQRQNENLAVADAPFRPGAPRFHDGVHRRFDEVLIDGDLQLDLVDQPHRQLMGAVNLGRVL